MQTGQWFRQSPTQPVFPRSTQHSESLYTRTNQPKLKSTSTNYKWKKRGKSLAMRARPALRNIYWDPIKTVCKFGPSTALSLNTHIFCSIPLLQHAFKSIFLRRHYAARSKKVKKKNDSAWLLACLLALLYPSAPPEESGIDMCVHFWEF